MELRGQCDRCPANGQICVQASGWRDEPDLAIVGEAPGLQEEIKGAPFVGDSGKLLRETLTALGARVDRIYYTNACLCRPTGDKPPSARHIAACHDRLMAELADVRPRLILPVGNVPLTSLIGGGRGITKRRGIYQRVEINGRLVGVVPTLHPAGILRDPEGYQDFLVDISHALAILSGAPPEAPPPYDRYEIVATPAEWLSLARRVANAGSVALDIETNGLDHIRGRIYCIALSWERERAASVDWGLFEGGTATAEANRRVLTALLECTPTAIQNAQFDALWLLERGIHVRLAADTMLMHFLLDERQGTHGLKRQAIDRYRATEYDADVKAAVGRESEEEGRYSSTGDTKAGVEIDPARWADPEGRRQVMLYNCADADYCYRLAADLAKELRSQELMQTFASIMLPAVWHCIDLEMHGILVDRAALDALGARWRQEVEDLGAGLAERAPGVNIKSPKQVAAFLFDTLGLRPMASDSAGLVPRPEIAAELAETDDEEILDYWRLNIAASIRNGIKARTTSTAMLYWLSQQDPWPRLLAKSRVASKRLDTYYTGLLATMWPDGRVRPRYRLYGARTGRLSSTDPNIHNIPRDSEIKRVFVADPGWVIIYADYAQAEVRMMAHYAGDEHLIAVMAAQDIHREIAKNLFQVTDTQLDAMSKDEREIRRRSAKTITFGLMYQRAASSLAPQLGVSKELAQAYIERFYQMMPRVREWVAGQKRLVRAKKEVSNLFGRKRHFDLILSRYNLAEVERQAVNFPIQSSVTDLTLLAHMRAIDELRAAGIPARVLPHIHDAMMLMVPEGDQAEAIGIVRECMEDVPFETRVPFLAEISVGASWGDLHPVA